MSELTMSKMDEITIRLVHYFITKENYQPVIVNGLDNEIWLENLDKEYSIIRISSNYIHNDEQLSFDNIKTKSVVKQIKKKTLSLKCNVLTILLNVNDPVSIKSNDKYNHYLKIDDVSEINSGEIGTTLFPEIKNDIIESTNDMDFFINVTNDINKKTEKRNELYEKTFMKKPILITYILIALNVIFYLLSYTGILNPTYFCTSKELIKNGEFYRLITYAFFHGGIIHLVCNMYSLYILGTQLETYMGKLKYTIVYFISAISAGLLSIILNGNGVVAVGASGAIFGLMGTLLYFGYHYRLYLGNALKTQILPVILLNLFIGFSLPYVDNFGHIGGLVGGLFAGMMVGINGKTKISDNINGIIVSIIYFGFLIYLLMTR